MKRNSFYQIFSFLAILFCAVSVHAQNTVSGTITDETSGETLIGASVQIDGTYTGAITDFDGKFTITSTKELPWDLVVSYAGYKSQTVTVEAVTDALAVKLSSGVDIQQVVVSASRRREKIQEAPASISVISAEKVENTAVANPINLLDNTNGVTIDKQGSGRSNIAMRGATDLFGTGAFVIMDYRSLVSAGIGTFDATSTALNTIDVAKVEVVRGPGSALYGPGVTDGVVHFLTKDAFKYPGTTVELVGGTLGTFRASARHAGHNEARTFGYKINAQYSRYNEWGYDLTDSTDAATVGLFQDEIIDPIDGAFARNTNNELINLGQNAGANVTLDFRPNSDLNVVLTGGLNYFEGNFWNTQGEGYQAGTDAYTQLRVQWKGLFAQIYGNMNRAPKDIAKKGFLYRSGQVSVIDREQLESQIQYSFDVDKIKTSMIVGGEFRGAWNNTEGRVYGRNEDDDFYAIYGGYLQTKTALHDKVDLVLAGRYDVFSAIDEKAFAPRAAIVYKHSPTNTFRASFNRASAPNSNLVLNIDFKLAEGPGGAFDVWLYGNKVEQTFNNQETSWFVPGLPNTPFQNGQAGMDMGTSYAFMTGAIAAEVQAGNPDLQALAPLLPILGDPATIQAVGALGVFHPGVTTDLNGNLMNIEPTPTSTLRLENTYELGYQGLLFDKLAVQLDLYRIDRKNFTALRQISPLVVLPTLSQDLFDNLVPTLTQIYTEAGVDDPAFNAAVTAAIYGGVAAAEASGPLGTVETDQMPDGKPHVAFGYRNFGQITYYGSDLGLMYYIKPEMTVFSNYSWVSQIDFAGEDLGESAESTNTYELNQAQHKIRAGFAYEPQEGIVGNIAIKHNTGFNSNLGLYSGPVEARTLVDLMVGYKHEKGIFTSVTVDNLFNRKYRTYPGFPTMGLRLLFTARYSF